MTATPLLPDGADEATDFEAAGFGFFHALKIDGFNMNAVNVMTMGQIAAKFTDETVFGRVAATASGAGPAPASDPYAATDAANNYHAWRNEEDWRLLQRYDENEDHRLFSRKNHDKYIRPSRSCSLMPFKEDFPITPALSGLSVHSFARSHIKMSRPLVEIPRENWGLTAYERQKTHDKVVVALSPKIVTHNIMGILTSQELEDYDIAAHSHSWKSTLKTLVSHA